MGSSTPAQTGSARGLYINYRIINYKINYKKDLHIEARITEESEQLLFCKNMCQLFVMVGLLYFKVNTSCFLYAHTYSTDLK